MSNTLVMQGQGGVGLITHWKNQVNHFEGCIKAECPFLAHCTSNPTFTTCPSSELDPDGQFVDPKWFHDYNFPDRVHEGHNTVLNSIFNKVADDLAGVGNALSLNITYISAGTGSAATVPSSTQLQIESYRALLVEKQRPSTGKITVYWFFSPSSVSGTWYEWALLCGGATGTLGTGVAANRWLDTQTKGPTDTLTGQYSIQQANL